MNNVKLVIISDKGFMVTPFNTTKGDTTMKKLEKTDDVHAKRQTETWICKSDVVDKSCRLYTWRKLGKNAFPLPIINNANRIIIMYEVYRFY